MIMWPFSKPKTMTQAGIFTGFSDWHSHILPGVDDGVQSIEESIEILNRYEELGFKRVWLTPHVMEDFPNTPENLRQRFEELKNAYEGKLELRLASENMIDSLFQERLESNTFLPIGEEGKHLLVETSYVNPPIAMEETIDKIMALGYFVILAHPERYRYMEEEDYRKWKEKGVIFQSNLMSFVGGYGESARKKAEWLLKEGMIDMLGSDIHRLAFFEQGIGMHPKKSSIIEGISAITSNPKIS